MKFSKGETVSHIGFRYQDQWCWTGMNGKGQWGVFPNAFVEGLCDGAFGGTGMQKKSRLPCLGLGRRKSRNEAAVQGRKTSILSTSSGGNGGGGAGGQPGLEVVGSPISSQGNGGSRFGTSPR